MIYWSVRVWKGKKNKFIYILIGLCIDFFVFQF